MTSEKLIGNDEVPFERGISIMCPRLCFSSGAATQREKPPGCNFPNCFWSVHLCSGDYCVICSFSSGGLFSAECLEPS